ncbi:hypothetical protein HGRIS_010268 [Hohenbuehelia grisea]|uniref:F-box domain-containing protein n=1 Tax=Hohenbuehelia grisea TaxID=104357 RepID=A0ABR3J3T4_9AGAR
MPPDLSQSLIPVPPCMACGRAARTHNLDLPSLEATNDTLNCVADAELYKDADKDQTELAFLDNSYARLEVTLQELQVQAECIARRRKDLRGKIANRDRVQASRRAQSRVPVEILSAIFAECSPVSETDSRQWPIFFGDRSRQCPWSIMQVCTRWRSVSLVTPALWRHLVIDLRNAPSALDGDNIRFQLFQHLQKASQYSIFVSVYVPSIYDRPTFTSILSLSSLWETFEIFLISNNPIFDMNTAIKDPPSRLKSLIVRELPLPDDTEYPDIDFVELTAFENAPELKSVTILAPYFDITLPLSQLEGYKIVQAHPITESENLATMKSIITCHLDFSGTAGETDGPTDDPTLLPNITTLTVSGDDYVLENITAPSLRALTIQYTQSWEFTIFNFFQRSAFPLRSMVIHSVTMDFDEFKNILNIIPSLESLSVSRQPTAFYHSLGCHLQSHLLPNLRALAVAATEPNSFNVSDFIDVVKGRLCVSETLDYPKVPLETVYLDSGRFPAVSEWREVTRLSETGLDIQLVYPTGAKLAAELRGLSSVPVAPAL